MPLNTVYVKQSFANWPSASFLRLAAITAWFKNYFNIFSAKKN